MVFVQRVHMCQSVSTLTMKTLLIIIPEHSLIESQQCWESERFGNSVKMQPIKSKNHESKSLMGPLKCLGAPGKYPLFHPPSVSGPVNNQDTKAKSEHIY